MDSNGYNESLFKTEAGRCYICKKYTQTVRHEVYYGTATRKQSKKYGLWVNICPYCHMKLHANPNTGWDKKLKEQARALYIGDDFVDRFITGNVKWWDE